MCCCLLLRGLDNAGKTTIVKRIMNEDVNSVSPTLGFIIKTIDFEGQVIMPLTMFIVLTELLGTSLISVILPSLSEIEHVLINLRGCWWPENTPFLLEKLFRRD